MRKIYFYVITLLLLTQSSFGQVTYTWIGGTTGDYQVATNWSPSRVTLNTTDVLAFNAVFPIAVANTPNQTVGAIAIVSGTSAVTFATNLATNVLTLTAAIPLVYTANGSIIAGDFLTIRLDNSAAFTMTSGTFGIAPSVGGKISINKALILSGGKLDFDVAGTGGTTITATGSIRYNSGIFTCSTTSAIYWATGSNYYHAATGASVSIIPTCTWQTGSTCTITGMNGGTTTPSGITANSFANLTWDCPSQAGTVDLSLPVSNVTISGTFWISSTNSNLLRFAGATGCNISAGSYIQTAGNIVLQTASGTSVLSVANAFSHTGGSIEAVAGTGAGTGILDLKGDVAKGASTTWFSSSTSTASQMIVQLSGSVSQIVNIAGTWSAPAAGSSNVTISNTDNFGITLTGTLQVVNTNSSNAAICNMGGIVTGSGNISYSGAGTGGTSLVYNGASAQTPSSIEFPSSGGPLNLTISNSLGVNFPGSFSRSVAGTFSLLNGNLAIGAGNTLSLTNTSLASQLVQFSGFITSGTLSRTFPTSGLPTSATASSRFPFGTGVNDRSVNVFFSGANLTGGSSGSISVSHTAAIGITTGTIVDDIVLDKKSKSNWALSSSGFSLGTGGQTISVTALATNIGQVSNIATLRLTNGVGLYGTTITATGTVDAPLIGKAGLVVSDINLDTVYVGSDNVNALTIITYTWTGSLSTDWTTPGNWIGGGSGYPSSPSQIADISSAPGNMPTINSGVSIQLYQLIVGAPVTLTLAGTASLDVTDSVNFAGSGVLSSSSTFIYSSAVNTQNIKGLTYGNLILSGPAPKVFPATLTVTGQYTISGAGPTIGTNTFIYAATGAQRITATNYYNLTITGNRAGNLIRLGNSVGANTIDIGNVFNPAGASNYTVNNDFNTINFSSSSAQTIPGFTYGIIRNVNAGSTGTRTFDPLGSTNNANVISCISLSRTGTASVTVTNSKVKFTPTGAVDVLYSGSVYHDLEFSGNMNGHMFDFFNGATLSIAGTFLVSLTNYVQGPNIYTIDLNGTGDQTIPAYKYINATSTPSYKYGNLTINGGSRNIILGGAGTDTIGIKGSVSMNSAFSAGKGFVVAGSTVNFSVGSANIPVLTPASPGTYNYNNICVTGGTRILSGDIIAGGNVLVAGTDASPATLTIGDGSANRTLNILGDLTVSGTSGASNNTGQLDFNTVSNTNKINLTGNLNITGTGQLTTGVGTSNGTIVFIGLAPQYTNTSIFKNGYVNFTVGNGISTTNLTLNNSLDLIRSSSAPYGGILLVETNDTLTTGTNNINIGSGSTGNASFTLKTGATLVTANTGGVEGTATSTSTGTILAGANIIKTYSPTANYVLNGATITPFPAAITAMNNLTIGANVSLNRAIAASGTLDLGASILTQSNNNLQFSGLKSTTGSIAADKFSSITISGTNGTVGTLRFAPGFNTTGEFTIARPVTIALGSDLIIDKVPLSGNYISGTATSILDINGNTVTINGVISGPGTLSGSDASNLTLGGSGAVGTLSFTTGKRILKNLTLNNNAKATLGTVLDITAGLTPGTEGTVSITGTAVLTTAGNLNIKSTVVGTARVSQGSNTGGYISGDVSVERYIASSTKRGWRLLSVPTYGQTIKQAWQENQPAGVNGTPGFGTIITSAASDAAWAANGFDYQSNSYSLLKYNSVTNGWDGVPNTSAALSASGANKSYMVFIRGDRSATPSNGPLSTETVLRTKGTLFQGDQPSVAVAAGQFGTIGNNFASAVDFTTVGDAAIDQSFSVWDPKLVGAYGLGGYVTFSASTVPAWKPTPGGASYTAGVANTLIQSGQAFVVHATGTTGNVTLKENGKATGSMMVFRPSGISSGLTTNLYAVTATGLSLADGNSVTFSSDYSNDVDNKDVLKPNNFGENLGLLRDGKTLVVEARQSITDADTIFFSTRKLKKQSYKFELTGAAFDNSLTGFLEDKYAASSTPLNLNGITNIAFDVNNDAASLAEDRFRIVFKSSIVLPVTIRTVSANKQSTGVNVEWKVENEINIRNYDVERATDGVTFTKVNTTVAASANATYHWLDVQPATGDVFYRIKSISNNGTAAYSIIVKVNFSKNINSNNFTIYPNPVGEGVIGLKLKDVPAGLYTIRLINSEGKVITKTTIQHNGTNGTQSIVPADKLSSGMYQLEVIGEDNKVNVLKVMVL